MKLVLKFSRLKTSLGLMIAVSDEKTLHFLRFEDSLKILRELEKLKDRTQSELIEGSTEPIRLIEKELQQYFAGELNEFKTPISQYGTSFQKEVWKELRNIPFGETRSYSNLAESVGNPLACRAVAQANASNPFVILNPCHRVILNSGEIGGYGCGVFRKKWLLEHEKNFRI